ncbi:MAG: hypothetical protein FWH00_04705, partial [Oscillospiraceae bacterium]|nr:hypothetical protein [Oscillospiraceae bacterium]
RAGAQNAVKKLNDAQNSVNQLYSQINSLNARIEDCRRAIRNAKWYQFWIPIGKGCEIAGYEIAKAGIYIAIGVANAALEIAKGCVIVGSKIGEGVLQIVNGIIKGVMNLFFLKKIELYASANSQNQELSAGIEFVALGKTYKFQTSYKSGTFNDKALSGSINGNMQNDLDNIEKGSFKSNFKRMPEESLSMKEHGKRLEAGRVTLESGYKLLDDIQEVYYGEFGEYQPTMEEINHYLMNCMSEVQASFETVRRLDILGDLERLVDITAQDVEESSPNTATRSSNRSKIKEYRKSLAELQSLTTDIYESMSEVDNMVVELEKNTAGHARAVVENAVHSPEWAARDGDMETVLDATESLLTRHFPESRQKQTGDLYIHLPRELVILDGLKEAREHYGAAPNKTLEKLRTRSRSGPPYTSRL